MPFEGVIIIDMHQFDHQFCLCFYHHLKRDAWFTFQGTPELFPPAGHLFVATSVSFTLCDTPLICWVIVDLSVIAIAPTSFFKLAWFPYLLFTKALFTSTFAYPLIIILFNTDYQLMLLSLKIPLSL
jgi:hypothetical protein